MTTNKSVMIWMSAVRVGDLVQLPGVDGPTRVTAAGFDMKTEQHRFQTAGTPDTLSFDQAQAQEVELFDRPGFGPFDAEYKVGDLVIVWWIGKERAGRVTEVFPDMGAYEVRTLHTMACVGPENMRFDPIPAPKVGQVWKSTTGKTLTVAAVVNSSGDPDPNGLCVRTEDHATMHLCSPRWTLQADPTLDAAGFVPSGWGDVL